MTLFSDEIRITEAQSKHSGNFFKELPCCDFIILRYQQFFFFREKNAYNSFCN